MVKRVLLGWLKRQQGPLKAKSNVRSNTAQRTQPQPFAGVTISSNPGDCCLEVRRIAGKRYLSHEAPIVQLPNCTAPVCRCVYVHFSDRRAEPRRNADHGIGIVSGFESPKERRGRGSKRRSSDIGK